MNRRLYLALVGSALSSLGSCSEIASDPESESPSNSNSTADATDPSTNGTDTSVDDPSADGSDPSDAPNDEPTVHGSYGTTEVRVLSPGGEELGSVTAAIADTPDLRALGLSDTEYLPEDRGMLFVFESVADRTFVMREMDFGIDIVYADAVGTITAIHPARPPTPGEDGNEQRYPGRGQCVLEVGHGWTSDRGVKEGDRLEFELEGTV